MVEVWEKASGGNKRDVEAMLNHIHMIDINNGNPDAEHNEAQLIELGKVLKEIYAAKLAWQFPDLRFEVVFEGEPGGDPADFQVTFWTVRD